MLPGPNVPSTLPKRSWLPFVLLIVLALSDLMAPPISPTIHRQTQTYAQMRNLADEGFSWDAFSIGINGPEPFRVIFEFPVYHALGAAALRFLSDSWLWPKLVSLLAALAALAGLRAWMAARWGNAAGELAAILLATIPIFLLLATAIQPDALALASTAGVLLAVERWRASPGAARWAAVLALVVATVLVKFTVLVPFVPVVVWLYLRSPSGFRKPRLTEIATAVVFVGVPFVWWLRLRAQHTDPIFLQLDRSLFIVGDLRRFLSPGFYTKPAFVLGAMVCAGAGMPLAVAGCRRLDAFGWALVAGIPFYFVAIPTVADQTYYSLPLAPIFALLISRGCSSVEPWFSAHIVTARMVAVAAWICGLAIALPYTLRKDRVTWDAARALSRVSAADHFALVLNMHDRGVGIGGTNPAMLVLAGRKGWNISPAYPDSAAIAAEVSRRRSDGARWLVATWFTPQLDPWFAGVLPAEFSRLPHLAGRPVDGHQLIEPLLHRYEVAASGRNFVVLGLE